MSKRLPWYKRDVDAWRGGTRGMSLELRGFYSECLDAMWDLQGPIPAEPEKLAVMFCCNPRTVRKLLPQLVGLGKLKLTPEGYANSRMEAEIDAANSTPIRSQLKPNSNGIRAEFDSKVSKNPMFSTRDLEVEEEVDKEEDKQPTQSEPVAVCVSNENLIELKSAFNGQTAGMLGDVAKWMPGYGNETVAAKWLQSLLSANGQVPTQQAYQMLLTSQAEGQIISSPLRWWSKTASNLKSKPQPQQSGSGAKRTLADVLRERKNAEATQ